METTYFVSGTMRTGTSMMMKALEAGGMDAAYDSLRELDNLAACDEHYKLNPGGLYELCPKQYQAAGFPRQYEGKLIKYLFGGLPRIVPGNYKIIFMRRDYEEVRQSQEAGLNINMPMDETEYNMRMDDTIATMRIRRDCEVFVLWYRNVVQDPLKSFNYLVSNGWPIDSEKAAAVIDPNLYRFKKEELETGI